MNSHHRARIQHCLILPVCHHYAWCSLARWSLKCTTVKHSSTQYCNIACTSMYTQLRRTLAHSHIYKCSGNGRITKHLTHTHMHTHPPKLLHANDTTQAVPRPDSAADKAPAPQQAGLSDFGDHVMPKGPTVNIKDARPVNLLWKQVRNMRGFVCVCVCVRVSLYLPLVYISMPS